MYKTEVPYYTDYCIELAKLKVSNIDLLLSPSALRYTLMHNLHKRVPEMTEHDFTRADILYRTIERMNNHVKEH